MNKRQMISELSDKLNVSYKDASNILNSFVNIITDTLTSGQIVNISWFWKFELSKRKWRAGFNPRTRETIKIAKYTTPVFRAGLPFKNAIKAKFN